MEILVETNGNGWKYWLKPTAGNEKPMAEAKTMDGETAAE